MNSQPNRFMKAFHKIRTLRFGCLTSTGLVSGLIAVFFIVGSALASGGMMYSPGELNSISGDVIGGVSSHAEIEGDCKSCHVAPWETETMDDRCSTCHTEIAAELEDAASVHGGMMQEDPNANCRDCHPEHHGASALLTVFKGWMFPHELMAYSLKGHQFKAENEPFVCADCHGEDVTTFDSVTCTKCHVQEDMTFMVDHMVTFGETCLDCHDGIDRFGDDFNHDEFPFKLNGKHAAVTCQQCHLNSHTPADLRATSQDCFSCHQGDDLHNGKLGTDCASCHSADGWKPSSFDHNQSDFRLDGSHIHVECEMCHANREYKGTPKDCYSCHEQDDEHLGQLGTDCAACHVTSDWKNITFNHDTAAFKLTGLHNQVKCTSCHVNGVFKGTPMDCYSCHAKVDAHNGQFGRNCSQCHTTSGWQNVSFDHNGTGFPLTGLHVDVACKNCHVDGVFKNTPKNCHACHAGDDAHNGEFGQDCATCHNPSGWKNVSFDHGKTAFPLVASHTSVACASCHVGGVYKGTPTDCYSCHAAKDKHNGQFGTDCGLCHKPTKWDDVVFDHSVTSFPLTGTHTNVACASCHVGGVYKGTPKDCYSCHAADDDHNGQFGTNCGSCHKPTRWRDVFFDHSVTSFPLTDSHTTVACLACHVNGNFQGTPTDCYSCHATDDNHNGQFGTNCGSCHRPTRWQDVFFDHSVTSFPLTDSHTNVACASCHVGGVYQGTPTDCYSCHATDDNHNGQFGTNCGSCHRPTRWQDVFFDHSVTSFPLVGRHTRAACSACHVNGNFNGTPTDCYSCHAADDDHNGQYGTNCGSCHSPTGWSNVTFDHDLTAFPLTGQHTRLVCTQCHVAGQYTGLSTTCASCHNEPTFHSGAFATACDQCHTTARWMPAPFAAHPRYNGERMLNHHGATCRTCHVITVNDFTCLDCHDSNNP
ncbi:MAG: NapC/NirT family cytochrome c [Chloroflexi bacterium]|nr:NapC/NirT family cytochrome c [Chloroflexota bacterium]